MAGWRILFPPTQFIRGTLPRREELRPHPGPDLDTDELRGRLTIRMGITILDAIPCAVIRASEPYRPAVKADAQGRRVYIMAGQDTPVLSDRMIAWLLEVPGGPPLERDFLRQLDTPQQGLLSTLRPLAEAIRSVQQALISTMSAEASPQLFLPLTELTGTFKKDIIRAFAARFREFHPQDTPVRICGPSLDAYAAAHAAAANANTGVQYPLVRFARARGNSRAAALAAIVGEADAAVPGRFRLQPPPRITAEEHPCLRQAYSDEDAEDGAPVSPRLLAAEVESLRELTAALLDETGTGRVHNEGAFTAVTARIAQIELRAPGDEQLATVDDVHMYAEAAARRVDGVSETHKQFEARLRAVEATLKVVATHMATGEPVAPSNPEIRAVQRPVREVDAGLAAPGSGPDRGPETGAGATPLLAPSAAGPDSAGSAARNA